MAQSNGDEELREELRQGSEARHYGDRLTPDGKERVEMVPLDWAVEVIMAERVNRKQHELEARIDELGRITGLFTTRSTSGEKIPAMKRLAELKAEREGLSIIEQEEK